MIHKLLEVRGKRKKQEDYLCDLIIKHQKLDRLLTIKKENETRKNDEKRKLEESKSRKSK